VRVINFRIIIIIIIYFPKENLWVHGIVFLPADVLPVTNWHCQSTERSWNQSLQLGRITCYPHPFL